MAMSRKHYRAMAAAIGKGCALDGYTRRLTTHEASRVFAQDNARFNFAIFREAVEQAARDFCAANGVELSPLQD